MVASALTWPFGYVWGCNDYDGEGESDIAAQMAVPIRSRACGNSQRASAAALRKLSVNVRKDHVGNHVGDHSAATRPASGAVSIKRA